MPSIPPERTGESGKKRHGDFAVALVLAHFASRMQWHDYGYTPVAAAAVSAWRGQSFWTPDTADDFAPRDPFRGPLGARIRGDI